MVDEFHVHSLYIMMMSPFDQNVRTRYRFWHTGNDSKSIISDQDIFKRIVFNYFSIFFDFIPESHHNDQILSLYCSFATRNNVLSKFFSGLSQIYIFLLQLEMKMKLIYS